MKKIIGKVNLFSCGTAAAALALLLFLTVLDVFLSNAFLVFIPGVFELSKLLLSLTVFFGVASAHAHYKHQYIDLLYKALPHIGKRALSLISSVLHLGACIVMAWAIIGIALEQLSRGELTWVHRLPLWVFSLLGAAGMLTYCLAIVGDMVLIIRDRGVLDNDAC
jgi:TRAP-type C4-dicarboxylate transport system permease small subunit